MIPRRITFLEAYDGGSHRAFRQGLARYSAHAFTALTLPARFWKWRMRGAAVWFADLLNEAHGPPPDLILTTSYVNVADLRGLLAPPLDRSPVLLYMHENQLTYPLSPEEEFDFHFGFTNIVSALAADRVVFNSDWHREVFLDALPAYLARMPEAVPRNVRRRLAARSTVLGVGLDREPLPAGHFARYRGGPCDPGAGPSWPRGERPLLVWNHRWEFDKRPELFARAVARLSSGARKKTSGGKRPSPAGGIRARSSGATGSSSRPLSLTARRRERTGITLPARTTTCLPRGGKGSPCWRSIAETAHCCGRQRYATSAPTRRPT